ncbi:MAG: hypothetical protein H0V07_13745 [Propionibacteriales bacterium]|nr:hypothetical protein [Propionibacteriales bacterium]
MPITETPALRASLARLPLGRLEREFDQLAGEIAVRAAELEVAAGRARQGLRRVIALDAHLLVKLSDVGAARCDRETLTDNP